MVWYSVDTDRSPQLQRRFAITTVPTMLLFLDGELEGRTEAAARHEVVPVLDEWFHQG